MAFLPEVSRLFDRLAAYTGDRPSAYPDTWRAPLLGAGTRNLPPDPLVRQGLRASPYLHRTRGDEGSGSAGDRDLGVNAGDFKWWEPPQESRRDALGPVAVGAVAAGNTGAMHRPLGTARDANLRQTLDALRANQYDFGRLQAEMQELALRHPEHAGGMNPARPTDAMPLQTIYSNDGSVLMQGRAESVEHLIALKLEEAAKTADPNKQVVNLAGAKLDEATLGRKLQLNGLNLQGVDMRGANLGGAVFNDCQIRNVDMTHANIKGLTVTKCHLENVTMTGVEGNQDTVIRNSSLYNVAMNRAEAPGMRLEGIRAEYIDMAGSNFAGAKWSDVKINNLWANNINLEGAKLGRVAVAGPYSSFENARMADITVGQSSFGAPGAGINMAGIQAPNSTWTDVAFNRTDLSRADFSGAALARVDMREVVTPTGPMIMNRADITNLEAGPEAKMTAQDATISGVTLKPVEDFVFSGTAPLQKAADAALSRGSAQATIVTPDGATTEAMQAGVLQQQVRRPAPAPLAAPAPPSPYSKKNSGGF